MKKVCIALDISPSAEKVAKLGYEYAKALKAEVVLIHVEYDISQYNYTYDPFMGYEGSLIIDNMGLIEDIKNETNSFLKSTANFLGDPNMETKVIEGNAYEEILKFSKEWGADLLVIGTHSHSALENALMGNIAAEIVKHSEIPMLIVPVNQKK